MRRALALLVLGALVVGAVYYWKNQPGRLPALSGDELGAVGDRLGSVRDTLGQVGSSVGERLRATRIKGAVKAALELDRLVSAFPIDVEAHDDGRVVLRGEVGSAEAKASAVQTAAGVADVTRVDDQLRVNPALAEADARGRSLGENFDDHALEAKVRLAFSLQQGMKGADVTVSAYRREVTLTGTVASEAQRELALQIARRAPQVASVKDALQVAGRPAAPPAAATAGDENVKAVQAALAANVNLAPYALVARMQGSRLVLTGRVRTGAERDLAGIVARDAAGTTIENNVVVKP